MRRLADPKVRRVLAVVVLAACMVGWPATVLATDEPVWILSLSWLALIFTALDLLATTDVRVEQDGE